MTNSRPVADFILNCSERSRVAGVPACRIAVRELAAGAVPAFRRESELKERLDKSSSRRLKPDIVCSFSPA
jgi:hypothetical protein